MDEATNSTKHYVCKGGCNGTAAEEGSTCQAQDCPNFGMTMETCTCTDGMHGTGKSSTADIEG